jgi:hypothetical protein
LLTALLAAPLALASCGTELGDTTAADQVESAGTALLADLHSNSTGRSRIVTANGAAFPNESTTPGGAGHPFFRDFDGSPAAGGGTIQTNGRSCVNCHEPTAAMGITPPQVQARFNEIKTDSNFPSRGTGRGHHPLFRRFDGTNGPLAPLNTEGERLATTSLIRQKGLIRIPFNLPANRDYDVTLVVNNVPASNGAQGLTVGVRAAANSTALVSFYRRPLLSANTRFISAVMWDGRETARANPTAAFSQDAGGPDGPGVQAFSTNAPVRQNMLTQAGNATTGHAEAKLNVFAENGPAGPLPTQTVGNISETSRAQITDLQMNLVVAQENDNGLGSTFLLPGRASVLRSQATYFGINDSHGGNPFSAVTQGVAFSGPFQPRAMVMYTDANGFPAAGTGRRNAIRRGQEIFNTRPIAISNVRGVNDVLGVATLTGSCTTCHSHPNVGNHPDILPLDLGLVQAASFGGDNILPQFEVRERSTGRTERVNDLGRAVLTGQFRHLGLMKGPTLRALSARPPFFHNGQADSITEVIDFYNTRFQMAMTTNEKNDLRAFMETL